MAKSKLTAETEIKVGGEPYLWWIQRRPHWSDDARGWVGMALAVRHAEGQREAVLEFPSTGRPRYGAPQLQPQHIDPKLVAKAITAAVEAGWEPLSRGKTVTIVVDAQGN